MAISKRAISRMQSGLKSLLPIIEQQKTRDVSESDTVTIVKDVLSQVLGYDKYTELTGEYAIRGTFCDLAVRLDDKITQLIEIKAIGISLNERHLKQIVNYAVNEGIEWVILTNGIVWQLYNVLFTKPINKHLIAEINLLETNPKREADREALYLFSKEGFQKGAHEELRDRQVATSKYLISALLLHNESVLSCLRRELRRVVDINVTEGEIEKVLREEVIKRETLQDTEAEKAAEVVNKAEKKRLRSRNTKKKKTESQETVEPESSKT